VPAPVNPTLIHEQLNTSLVFVLALPMFNVVLNPQRAVQANVKLIQFLVLLIIKADHAQERVISNVV